MTDSNKTGGSPEPRVTDDEAWAVREIVREHDALGDPYAWHKGIEHFLRTARKAIPMTVDELTAACEAAADSLIDVEREGSFRDWREFATTLLPKLSSGALREAPRPEQLDLEALEQIYGSAVERIATHWADGDETAGCVYSHRECAIMALIAEVRRRAGPALREAAPEPSEAAFRDKLAQRLEARAAGLEWDAEFNPNRHFHDRANELRAIAAELRAGVRIPESEPEGK